MSSKVTFVLYSYQNILEGPLCTEQVKDKQHENGIRLDGNVRIKTFHTSSDKFVAETQENRYDSTLRLEESME